jgi:hypothetical protein
LNVVVGMNAVEAEEVFSFTAAAAAEDEEEEDFLIPPLTTVPLRALPCPPTLTGAMVVLSSGEAAACGDVESFEESFEEDDSKSEPYELVFDAGDPTSEGSIPSMALISAALPTLTLSMLMLESKLSPEDESMVLEMRLEAPPPPPLLSPIEEPKAPKKS